MDPAAGVINLMLRYSQIETVSMMPLIYTHIIALWICYFVMKKLNKVTKIFLYSRRHGNKYVNIIMHF